MYHLGQILKIRFQLVSILLFCTISFIVIVRKWFGQLFCCKFVLVKRISSQKGDRRKMLFGFHSNSPQREKVLGLLLQLSLDFVNVLSAVVTNEGKVRLQHRLVSSQPGVSHLKNKQNHQMTSKLKSNLNIDKAK